MTAEDKRESTKKPKKRPTFRFSTGEDVKECGRKLGLNHNQFWSGLGVTQSGGSRYESGRKTPMTVQRLLHMTYGTEKQAQDLLGWLRSKEG